MSPKKPGQQKGGAAAKKAGLQSPATPNPAPSKARISGTVTNTKTVPRSKATAVKNARRKSLAASSSGK